MLNLAYLTTLTIEPDPVRRRCDGLKLATGAMGGRGRTISQLLAPELPGARFPEAFESLCTGLGGAILGHAEQLGVTAESIVGFADGVEEQDQYSSRALEGAQ